MITCFGDGCHKKTNAGASAFAKGKCLMAASNQTVYKIWAPEHAIWCEWAKPVLFAQAVSADYYMPPENAPLNWLTYTPDKQTALIIDLPGKNGVSEGMAAARAGFRPVPLYNGVAGPPNASLVDVSGITSAMFSWAKELAQLKLKPDAPPAFLLDADRMKVRVKLPGKYDNRWCVFPQDMPSALFLEQQGIKRVVVRTELIANDLSHILLRYQERGIQILHANGRDPVKEKTVVRPSLFKSLMYRFSVTMGLTRNAAGGFGGPVPEPQQRNARHRRYGYG